MKPLPDVDDCRGFSKSEALEYISEVIEQLNQCEKTVDMSLVHDLMLRISSTYYDLDEHMDLFCAEFIKKDLVKSIYYFLWILSYNADINDETLYLIYVFLINFTDYSESFSLAVYSSKIFELLINNCLDEKNARNIANKSINTLLEKSLRIINNIVRDPSNVIKHNLTDLKKSLLKFIEANDNDILGIMSILALSYIVDDDESSLLDQGSNAVNILLQKIKYVMESGGRSSGFEIYEMVNGIRNIATNDKMKIVIRDKGGIPILLDIMKRNIDKEIEPTLGTIWNLCFNNEIKMELIMDHNIEKVVETFKNHKSGKIRENYNGILFEIKDKMNRPKRDDSKPKVTYDVFMSYSWSNKTKIFDIYTYLVNQGFSVWLDENKMFDDSLAAMASGIEDSTLIIIGISRSYMKSPNCRSEAEYAYQRRKPIIPLIMELKFKPYSWLGIIVGTKMYYEFSERRKVEDVIKGLVKSIKLHLNKGGTPDNGDEEHPQSSGATYERSDSIPKISKLSDVVKDWTCSQVGKWLEGAHLGHLTKKFATVNGTLLEIMLDLRTNSPEYFNKTLKNEFGIKFIDVLKLHQALNKLYSF